MHRPLVLVAATQVCPCPVCTLQGRARTYCVLSCPVVHLSQSLSIHNKANVLYTNVLFTVRPWRASTAHVCTCITQRPNTNSLPLYTLYTDCWLHVHCRLSCPQCHLQVHHGVPVLEACGLVVAAQVEVALVALHCALPDLVRVQGVGRLRVGALVSVVTDRADLFFQLFRLSGE